MVQPEVAVWYVGTIFLCSSDFGAVSAHPPSPPLLFSLLPPLLLIDAEGDLGDQRSCHLLLQVSVVDELSIPVKFVGVGEGVEDLQPFDAEAFVDAIFS